MEWTNITFGGNPTTECNANAGGHVAVQASAADMYFIRPMGINDDNTALRRAELCICTHCRTLFATKIEER